MNHEKLESLIARTQSELDNGALSSSTKSEYRRYGFEEIRKHFRECAEESYSESLADELILKKRALYENKEIPSCKWHTVRKCAALLSSMHNTGKLGPPRLPSWRAIHNPLRQKPSGKQLGDKDNLFALVYLTKQEMLKFNYCDRTAKRYERQGFDPILRHCLNNGVTTYSREMVENFVLNVSSSPDESNRARLYIQKTALMLDEFYETGKLEWRHLERKNLRIPIKQFSRLLDSFCAESEEAGTYSDGTIRNDRIAVRQLLFLLEDTGHICFETVALGDISDCMSSIAKQNPSLSYFHNIRKFLRYLYRHRKTGVDLSAAIPRIIPPRTVIQEGFTQDEIDSLLNCVDKNSIVGKRNYAVMMLAAQTGLRSVDIAGLKLSDIDWHSKTISITQEKTKRPLLLNLPTETGNAIVSYILHGRPESDFPFVFLTARPPFRKLESGVVSAMVSNHMRRVGISDSVGTHRRGAHSFRRAFSGRLLESETPIELLSELLGHSHINSSKPYLSANEIGLKGCALGIIPQEKAGDAQ